MVSWGRVASKRIVRKPKAGRVTDDVSQVGARFIRFAYVKVPYKAYKSGGKKK